MEFEEAEGMSLAVILTKYNREGHKTASYVLNGTVEHRDGMFVIDLDDQKEPFILQPQWAKRIKPVQNEIRHILKADICLSLTIGPKPQGASIDDFEQTGLKLPE